MRLMRILRIGRLMRLARLRAIIPRVESKLKEIGNHNLLVAFKMGKFLMALLLFAHILACCWAALGDMEWDAESELDRPWMQATSGEGGVLIADLSLSRRFAFSFAWSTAVLLQGAVVPPFYPGTWMKLHSSSSRTCLRSTSVLYSSGRWLLCWNRCTRRS
jgi:hypothetical protein